MALARRGGVDRQPHADAGDGRDVAARLLAGHHDDLLAVQHGELHRFAQLVAQPHQRVLGGQPQVEIAQTSWASSSSRNWSEASL